MRHCRSFIARSERRDRPILTADRTA
jgi:hypothetical protein